MTAEARPPGTLSAKELRAELGVSLSTLGIWRRAGCPHERHGRRIWYVLEAVRSWMAKVGRTGKSGGDMSLRAPANPAPGGANPPAHSAPSAQDDPRRALVLARLRSTIAQAQRYELDLAERRGELVPRAEALSAFLERVTYTRSRLLGAPATLAPRVSGETEPEAERILREWVLEILAEFSEGSP